MKKFSAFLNFLFFYLILSAGNSVIAGPPFNAIEGEGGVALNPLAYTANSKSNLFESKLQGLDITLSNPQIGGWYIGLEDTNVNWGSWSVAETFFKRLETSYGYELVRTSATYIHKHNIGAKLALLDENAFNTKFLPAVSFGSILKNTSDAARNVENTGADFYLVTTKMITELPKPVLLSGGVLFTRGHVNGIMGFDSKWDAVGFGNIDVVILSNLVAGWEIKQGPEYRRSHSDGWKDANYFDTHLGWMVNRNLTFIVAYVNTDDERSAHEVGLGDGFVLSGQYAF